MRAADKLLEMRLEVALRRAQTHMANGEATDKDLVLLRNNVTRLDPTARQRLEDAIGNKNGRDDERDGRYERRSVAATVLTASAVSSGLTARGATKASQAAALTKLEQQVQSGLIERVGKGPNSKSQFVETVDVDGEALYARTITTANGSVVSDLRTAQEMQTVEVKKLVAKAVGLALSKAGFDGRSRSALVSDVVERAMQYKINGVPADPEKLGPRDAAAVAVANRIDEIVNGDGPNVDLSAVQQQFLRIAHSEITPVERSVSQTL